MCVIVVERMAELFAFFGLIHCKVVGVQIATIKSSGPITTTSIERYPLVISHRIMVKKKIKNQKWRNTGQDLYNALFTININILIIYIYMINKQKTTL